MVFSRAQKAEALFRNLEEARTHFQGRAILLVALLVPLLVLVAIVALIAAMLVFAALVLLIAAMLLRITALLLVLMMLWCVALCGVAHKCSSVAESRINQPGKNRPRTENFWKTGRS
jgi:uncharacterized membrane protein